MSPEPDVRVFARAAAADELLILGCDGIWDVMSNQEACDEARALLSEGEADMGAVAEELLLICLEKGSADNMTALLVAFPAAAAGADSHGGRAIQTPLSLSQS